MKNAPFNKRLGFAMNGLFEAFKSESSFRFQVLAAIGAYVFLAVMMAPPVWWAAFTLAVAGVLGAELFNTALEHLSDHLHPDLHPAIKFVKDCSAGAVLVFSFCSVIVMICFLCERLVP